MGMVQKASCAVIGLCPVRRRKSWTARISGTFMVAETKHSDNSGPNIFDNYTNYMIPYKANRPLAAQNLNGFRDYYYSNSSARQPRAGIALSVVFQPNETYHFRDSETLLASMQASECALQICAQILETRVGRGITTESTRVDASGFERVSGSFTPVTIDRYGYHCRTDDQARAIYKVPGKSLNMYNHSAFDIIRPRDYGSSFVFLPERTDLQLKLKGEIARSLNVSDDVQTSFNITQASTATIIYHLAKTDTLESITRALMDSYNISTTFEQAAKQLTFRMREVSGTFVTGEAKQTVTFVRPLALDRLKADMLATLLHGLDSDTRDMMRERNSQGLSAEKISVRLRDGHCGSYLQAERP
ncbi:hypothetical protein QBC44DRAFT_403011 [Cladorrhinum sp. PSN332]|nr:hypothetical protein QBC44DRAFT_403011 [Cladorrhinum sp. PSN332]